MNKADLKLDWCSYEAAKYAVEHWHYSCTMPVGKLVKIGVWEAGAFVGSVIFGMGAAPQAACPYKIGRFQIAELLRVALRIHCAPVSRIVAIGVRCLVKQSPGLRLLVSYADPSMGHHGGIYQALGWVYVGPSQPKWKANGQHNRTLGTSMKRARAKYGPNVTIKWEVPKHKYLMPLDAEMRARILPLAKPYPKRAGSIAANAPADQAGEGGAAPTPALSR